MDVKIMGGEVRIDTEGEGSRGGHVIGHTSSGKPVYSSHHPSHDDFSRNEHIEAMNIHGGILSQKYGHGDPETELGPIRDMKMWHKEKANPGLNARQRDASAKRIEAAIRNKSVRSR